MIETYLLEQFAAFARFGTLLKVCTSRKNPTRTS